MRIEDFTLIEDFRLSCAAEHCEADISLTASGFCPRHRDNAARARRREAHELTFCGVDGEGTGSGSGHRYVLLGCGENYVTWPDGITSINQPFTFLYECFEKHPDWVYAGFFLGYDFNMILRTLPRERAERLLTEAGKESRMRRKSKWPVPFPVRYEGWEFDMLGYRRLKLRPEGAEKWMWINDAGPFYQCSLLKAIDPADWPVPIVTPGEYATLRRGKERRATARLDDEMIFYNQLENEVLARLLARNNTGLSKVGVRLDKRQWFGPGQAAGKWMNARGLGPAADTVAAYPAELGDAITGSLHFGWFELAAHGLVPGISHDYDINSAYPSVAAQLPCPCGQWEHTPHIVDQLPAPGSIALLHCEADGDSAILGPLPLRTRTGSITRPLLVRGWYWAEEVRAALAAGLITPGLAGLRIWEAWTYHPCGHPPPLADLTDLYTGRLLAGKNSPEGRAAKLVYNSVFGKCAQTTGLPRYGNPLYASLITSGCRTAILNAIATHPRGADAVLMVATDGITFTDPHPGLPLSDKLGEWEHKERASLCLFKPGVYWDEAARKRIAAGDAPEFRARGISARDFARCLDQVDELFATWRPGQAPWPEVTFTAAFAQVSVLQALAWTRRQPHRFAAAAGLVREDITLRQSARPGIKRDSDSVYRDDYGVWRTRPHAAWPDTSLPDPLNYWSYPYTGRKPADPADDFGQLHTPDGPVMLGLRQALGVG